MDVHRMLCDLTQQFLCTGIEVPLTQLLQHFEHSATKPEQEQHLCWGTEQTMCIKRKGGNWSLKIQLLFINFFDSLKTTGMVSCLIFLFCIFSVQF